MNAPDFIKLPPHSVEAEQSLLGGLLLGGEKAWDRIADVVAGADFYRDDHRRIFCQIRKLAETAKPVDVLTVSEAIERANQSDQMGGIAYLGEIANATPSVANIRRYAEIVADHAARRRLAGVASEIATLAHGKGDARAAIDEAQRLLIDIADAGPSRSEPTAISAVLGSVIEDLETRFNSDASIAGLSTGFADLDRKLSGLQQGDLIILAGRPSMGKTAMALNIAESVATSGKPALVFSLEMGERQLATRSLSSLGSVPMDRLRSGRLIDTDYSPNGAHGAASKLQKIAKNCKGRCKNCRGAKARI